MGITDAAALAAEQVLAVRDSQTYPLTGFTVETLLIAEGRLPRTLDYGMIVPILG